MQEARKRNWFLRSVPEDVLARIRVNAQANGRTQAEVLTDLVRRHLPDLEFTRRRHPD